LCQMVRGREHLTSPADDHGSSGAREAPRPPAGPLTREAKKRRLTAVDLKVFSFSQLHRWEKAEAAAQGQEFYPEDIGCESGEDEHGHPSDGFVRWDGALGYRDDHGHAFCLDCAITWLDELE
ncbi:MAG: hypothetical protein ACRDOP_15940, partial [Gaiellaceae bacterium]